MNPETPPGPQYAWDDAAIEPSSDDARTRLYRRLQSWYRQERLHARHGWTAARPAKGHRRAIAARPVGSLLDPLEVRERPALNFLHPSELSAEILAYVAERVPIVRQLGGTLEEHRLRHNMLSSMPMCFNLFVPLRNRPSAAVPVLRSAFALDVEALDRVDGIDGIECEWAPPPDFGLHDRTAFDAVICYRNTAGERCLLGVETKYTEPFSTREYGAPGKDSEKRRRAAYEEVTKRSGWLKSAAANQLYRRDTNQLWRNTMLAAACESVPGVDRAGVAVIHLNADPHADAALLGVRAELSNPDRLRDVSWERLLRLAVSADLSEWATAFADRYTNISQTTRASVEERDAFQRRLDHLFPGGCVVYYDIGDTKPYAFNCPHPVATLEAQRVKVILWREDNWAGTYDIGIPIEQRVPGSSTVFLDLDGGRFMLSNDIPAEFVDPMRRLRLSPDEIERWQREM